MPVVKAIKETVNNMLLTFSRVRHNSRVPLGHIAIEYVRQLEHCPPTERTTKANKLQDIRS